MKIETGTPPCDGRYVIYVQRELSDYVEPSIADRLHNNWLWRADKAVLGWIGPLPPPMTADGLRGFRQVEAPEPRPDCPGCGGRGRVGPFVPGGVSAECGNCKIPTPVYDL